MILLDSLDDRREFRFDNDVPSNVCILRMVAPKRSQSWPRVLGASVLRVARERSGLSSSGTGRSHVGRSSGRFSGNREGALCSRESAFCTWECGLPNWRPSNLSDVKSVRLKP